MLSSSIRDDADAAARTGISDTTSATSLENSTHPVTPSSSSSYFEDHIELPSGVSMQVLSQTPATNSNNHRPSPVVLLFLHGSFHGAWCWAERWFDYFTTTATNDGGGYTVVAPSWRGTGGTPAGAGVTKVRIGQHVADLEALLQALPDLLRRRHGYNWDSDSSSNNAGELTIQPVVICHSFAGLAVMKYLERHIAEEPFRGVVTICSVPPSGNGKMTLRYLRRSWRASWRITVGFAMKKCLTSTDLCRQLFFGGDKVVVETAAGDENDGTTTKAKIVVDDHGLSDEDVERYQSYFARDSKATIDLIDLNKILPSSETDDSGRANFLQPSAAARGNYTLPPCLVMGAKDDYIVDREGLEETARYFGLVEPLIVDSPHDVMLGRKWKNGAEALKTWLEETF